MDAPTSLACKGKVDVDSPVRPALAVVHVGHECMFHRVLTKRILTTRCSLIEKMPISSTVMMRSCRGLVLPRTAPKEIRTVAVLKSALIILQDGEEKRNDRMINRR